MTATTDTNHYRKLTSATVHALVAAQDLAVCYTSKRKVGGSTPPDHCFYTPADRLLDVEQVVGKRHGGAKPVVGADADPSLAPEPVQKGSASRFFLPMNNAPRTGAPPCRCTNAHGAPR